MWQRGRKQAELREVAGFGRVNFSTSVTDQGKSLIRLYDETEPGLLTGEQRKYPLSVQSATHFKAVLAWYDAPGETLINDLDLSLLDSQGTRVYGNHTPGNNGQPDKVNTVEVIDVADLPAGEYTLLVSARNVPQAPQAYALAVLLPKQHEIRLETAVLSGIGQTYADHLAQHGISRLSQLLELSETQLKQYIGLGGSRFSKLYTNIQLLQQTLNWSPPADLPVNTVLADFKSTKVPQGLAASSWNTARQVLLPVLPVFDRQELSRICVRDLFG